MLQTKIRLYSVPYTASIINIIMNCKEMITVITFLLSTQLIWRNIYTTIHCGFNRILIPTIYIRFQISKISLEAISPERFYFESSVN